MNTGTGSSGSAVITSNRRADAASGRSALLLPPVIERELRVALHRRNARKARSNVARIGVIGVAIFMLLGALMGSAEWGRSLHFLLFVSALALAVGPALRICVGLFAEERRQQTLELLYLTGMGSAELFIGKLLGGVLVSSGELLALGPLMAVPFLSGGVSFELFLDTVVCLPTIFFLVLTFGMLGSALCRDEGSALVVAGILLAVFCLALPLPYTLGEWLSGLPPFNKSWLAFSPALAPWLVANGLRGFPPSDFWASTSVSWAVSILCLIFAAFALKRNWHRDLQGTRANGWRSRWDAYALGNVRWREQLRRRVLSANAYQWLVQQDRRPVLHAWSFIAAVCVVWLLGFCAWPGPWLTPISLYTSAALLLVGMNFLMSHAAARRMAADRRDGALELLLTTPLNPRDIVNGQKAALREQFRPVKVGLTVVLSLMVLAGYLARNWTPTALTTYLAVWTLFFGWCWRPGEQTAALPMWVAANCGLTLYSAFRTGRPRGRVWTFYWIWMFGNSFGALGRFGRSFPSGSLPEAFVVVSVVFWLLIFVIASGFGPDSTADSLVIYLRPLARTPLPERNDPRFKQWKDARQLFPGLLREASGGREPSKPIKAAGAWFWRPVGRVCGLAWGTAKKAASKR